MKRLGVSVGVVVLLTACGPSEAEIEGMIDDAVESALEAAQTTSTSDLRPTTTSSAPAASSTVSTSPDTTQRDYEEGYLYGYRNGFLTGALGDLPARLDDRDPSDAGDRGYLDGYATGYDLGSNAYWTDGLYAFAMAAQLADDATFGRVLQTGELSLAELGWEEGRAEGRETGDFHSDEGYEAIPITELITGNVEFSQATFQTISPYTVGYLLGYAEGLSDRELDVAAAPTDPYERGTQVGFSHGAVTLFNGVDPEVALIEAGISESPEDPLSFDGGFLGGFDLGLGILGE